MCAAGILVSGTRSVWLSLAVVVAFIILKRLEGVRRLASVLAVSALIVAAGQIPGVSTFITERAETALSTGGAGRTDIWIVGLTIFREAPFQGVGLHNFESAYTAERVRESDVGVYSLDNPKNVRRAPHSIVIGTMGELGVIGLALLGLFLLPLVMRVGWGPAAEAAQAALAGLLVTALFLDLLNRKQVWLLIGITSGLLFLRGLESARAAWSERTSADPSGLRPADAGAVGG
jgi:O-antigen ligase